MLTGEELKAKFAQLRASDATEDQAAIACGYVTAEGKPLVRRFKDALQEAHGLALPKATKARAGKPLSFSAKVAKSGTVPITAGYTALIGAGPEDRITIEHVGETLILRKAAAAPTTEQTPF